MSYTILRINQALNYNNTTKNKLTKTPFTVKLAQKLPQIKKKTTNSMKSLNNAFHPIEAEKICLQKLKRNKKIIFRTDENSLKWCAVLFAARYRLARKHQILLTFEARVTIFLQCIVCREYFWITSLYWQYCFFRCIFTYHSRLFYILRCG